MSRAEYEAMISTGRVQQGGGGKTDVCRPADPAAYQRQARPGSIYVEFEVADERLIQGGREDWASIPGPGSFHAKLRGNFEDMPEAENVRVVECQT